MNEATDRGPTTDRRAAAPESPVMLKPPVYLTRRLPAPALAKLADAADIRLWDFDDAPVPREALLSQITDVEGLLCLLSDQIDAEIINAGKKLKVVSQYAVGVDNIDLAACRTRGIAVGNTPGVLAETTADLAFALLLAAARDVRNADEFVRAGHWKTWSPLLFAGPDVHGATLGIVGMGTIGQAVAQRARGFDMRVLYASRRAHPEAEEKYGAARVNLDELLSQSDFVSLHTALTPETNGLIGARELSLMKPTAILINTARGPVVNQTDLYDALRDKKIAGAALDVFEVEPVPGDEPLLTLPNVLVAPHMGSASVSTRTKMAFLAVENLLAGLRGDPLPHPVT